MKTTTKDVPKFMDIQKINGIPYMFLRFNEKFGKKEWLCLEVPDTPKMSWQEGREWCQSKGGDYGEIPTLEFISKRRDEINKVLKANSYPVIERGGCWSTERSKYYSWVLEMMTGSIGDGNKIYGFYVRAVLSI